VADVNDAAYEAGQRTSLMSACFKGHTHVASLLLDNGADVNAQDEYGTTALSFAVNANKGTALDGTPLAPGKDKPASYHLAQLLISHGAAVNIRIKEGGVPPLHFAISAGPSAWDMAKLLIESGATVNTPLISELYLAGGMAISARSTAVHMAVATGNLELVETILSHDADLEVVNESGEVPADLARRPDQIDGDAEKILNLLRVAQTRGKRLDTEF
jgi:ankyrin repeat protein